jgi:ssDNA-binding Zn-finger/Zn-ribbon topoisomerase 1
MTTDCSKCGTPMRAPSPPRATSPIQTLMNRMTITAHVCEKCGHYNNLKRRKGYKKP